MIYDTRNKFEAANLMSRVEYLISKKKRVLVSEKRYKRTLKQNSYFHLLCQFFGCEFGYSLEEVKSMIKTEICADMFMYEKNDHIFYKSSADLDTGQFAKVIDRFKNYSAKNGLVLPEEEDESYIEYIQDVINKNYQYL